MNERLNALVGARITEFRRKMATVKKTMRSMPKRTVTTVTVVTKEAEKRIELFQGRIHRLANSIRAFGTVLGNMGMGSLLIASPSMVPIIAAATGLLGTMGPLLAVAGSNVFALAAAFGVAGGSAVAFGAAAMPTIAGIIDGTAEATEENKKAMKALGSLKKTWEGVQKAISPQVAVAFKNAMMGLETATVSLNPMFKSVADSISIMSAQFNGFMSSSTAQEFFGYLNKNAAPILEKVVAGIGGLFEGFMNLTVGFKPMTDFMAQGFKNMGQSFADFTERIKGSDGLKSFIDYLQTNGPKIWAILENITLGLVGMFTAFGPLASDMMTGFQNLTARFKEWGQSLSDNQQFQKFIGYIRDNAPTVISLIGNITTFLVNLGIAMAPIGAKMLEIVNNFFAWTSSMMAAHPWFGKLVAVGTMLIGAFMMILPPLIAIRTAFAGLPAVISTLISKALPLFTMFKNSLVIGLKMLGTRFYLLGTKVMAAATTMVKWFGTMATKAATWAATTLAKIASVIARFAVLSAKATLHAGKVAVAFLVTKTKAAASWAAATIASIAKVLARYAVLAAKSMVHAAKVAASWVVAMGPVGWVIATVVGLVALIIANWDKVKSWTVKTWNKIWGSIKDIVQKIWNKVTDIFGNIVDFFGGIDLYASGKAIIQSAIDGIMDMKNKIVGTVENIVGKVRDLWPFSPAKTGPLSDIHRMDFGGPIGKSIARARKPISSSMEKLAGLARNAFTPQLALADVGATAYVDTSMAEGTQAIEHAFNTDVDDFELPEKDIVIQMNDREVGRGTFNHIKEFMNREKADKERFS
ncbi:hypothetical protein [Oceanobacillus kimchii]|uniref:hypothetical protein n=1 Tax=Oceanobacillus kimchii TaxID=746691 RepID=UPI003B02494D